MDDLLLSALALVLVFEGLLPFLSPAQWRRLFERALRLSDAQIRVVGLSCLVVGAGLLLLFRG